ncbi:hypothetical protein AHIS1636_25830 [Arthrobacter mangrovi]|uniref:Uncharacterized protein n=1 Tax=Arthrobacter mangrovi TaxID=2966350 RepID=A0ABQ5MW00_9MICC|nr:hypothetical protein AHIS1636_25830 [Arthrobacter mangrovi]
MGRHKAILSYGPKLLNPNGGVRPPRQSSAVAGLMPEHRAAGQCEADDDGARGVRYGEAAGQQVG